MLQFQVPTRVVSGPDALGALSALSGRRVLVITDGFMAAAPLMDQVRDRLGDAVLRVFSDVRPDPDTHAIAAALGAYLEFGPEALIGLGGALAWWRGLEVAAIVPWWLMFLVVTIIGERLELARLVHLRNLHLPARRHLERRGHQ